jgi:hypothetical protein
VLRGSISSLQSVVGFVAGITSIVGALYSAMRYVKPAPGTGEVVAVVRSAATDQPIAGATIEVVTREDALVATLTPSQDGQARQALKEGTYRVRVIAPRFVGQARAIQVQQGATAELRFALAERGEPSPTAGRSDGSGPVSKSMNAAQRFFHRLGL